MQTGVIYCGDNLPRLAQMPAESVDLIYLDPPFFSNRQYEVIWGDEAEVRSFEDRWQGGVRVYIEWMRERVIELHRILKPTGSLYLHCDSHASHYLKVMLDDVFLSSNFLSEVVWKRTGTHSSAKRWGPVHDALLLYAKSAGRHTWNRPYVAHDEKHRKRHYRATNESGRAYTHGELTAPGTRNGRSGLPWRGFDVTSIGRHWCTTVDRLDLLDEEGRIYLPEDGGWPRLIRYQDESRGRAVGDVWIDIPPLNMKAKERLGYPTQKPEALLKRIIEASSNVGDVILDPFAGCGTATAVAQQIGREWVGVDISPTAVELMRRRLLALGATEVRVVGMPVSIDALRRLKPFEFQNWVIQRMNGTHSPRKSGDMGIDGYSFFLHEPIQVKQSDNIGRPVVDSFETAVQRSGKQKGYIVGFSFTRGAREETARVKQDLGLEIDLIRVSDLLKDVPSLITPVGGRGLISVPRPANTLPSADELIRSDLKLLPGHDVELFDQGQQVREEQADTSVVATQRQLRPVNAPGDLKPEDGPEAIVVRPPRRQRARRRTTSSG